jgi:hypothetical protein
MVLINRLVSLNKHVSQDFINHIGKTKSLCIYKLGNHIIPKNIFFPNAKYLTLINCNNNGVVRMLYPEIFPNIKVINYLSTNIGNYTFHKRFSKNVQWVFPDKNYEFFNFMVETGYGKKDPDIIKRYISNKKIIDGKNGFDISFEFDINVPGYGIVNGEWWRSQFYEYLVKKQALDNKDYIYLGEDLVINQELEEAKLEKERVISELTNVNLDEQIE